MFRLMQDIPKSLEKDAHKDDLQGIGSVSNWLVGDGSGGRWMNEFCLCSETKVYVAFSSWECKQQL